MPKTISKLTENVVSLLLHDSNNQNRLKSLTTLTDTELILQTPSTRSSLIADTRDTDSRPEVESQPG